MDTFSSKRNNYLDAGNKNYVSKLLFLCCPIQYFWSYVHWFYENWSDHNLFISGVLHPADVSLRLINFSFLKLVLRIFVRTFGGKGSGKWTDLDQNFFSKTELVTPRKVIVFLSCTQTVQKTTICYDSIRFAMITFRHCKPNDKNDIIESFLSLVSAITINLVRVTRHCQKKNRAQICGCSTHDPGLTQIDLQRTVQYLVKPGERMMGYLLYDYTFCKVTRCTISLLSAHPKLLMLQLLWGRRWRNYQLFECSFSVIFILPFPCKI